MNPEDKPLVFATAPFSKPIIIPEAEDVQLNGFAFSMDFGILVALRRPDDPANDPLIGLRKNDML